MCHFWIAFGAPPRFTGIFCRWVESEARRVLREVLNAREQERRQEVTPPVARTRRTRSEVSDDDEGDDDDDANSVGAGAAA